MRQWHRVTACAVALTAVSALAAGCSTSSSSGGGAASVTSLTSALPTGYGPPEGTGVVSVGAVPAMDSAGFFVALHDGLFAKEGLTIKYTPAVSSETAIKQQLDGTMDISAGNYVSYIEAAAQHNDPLEIVAQGSVMQAGAQTLFVMPNSKIKTLADLKGATIATNAPNNIDALLGVSVLQENGVNPSGVKFTGQPIAFPSMGSELAAGQFSAAILPEPFASEAEQQYGAIPLADLNQGATSDFPIEGYVATKKWAAQNPNTLKRFLAALEVGQEISDTDRAAVEAAFESIDKPQDGQVSAGIGAVMALDTYPIGVNATQLQRVADVMYQFGVLKSRYSVTSMLMPSSEFSFAPFSESNS